MTGPRSCPRLAFLHLWHTLRAPGSQPRSVLTRPRDAVLSPQGASLRSGEPPFWALERP